MRKIEDLGGSYRAVRLGTRWYPVLVERSGCSVPGGEYLRYVVGGREDWHVITAANYSRAYRTQVGFRSLKALRESIAPYLPKG